MPPARFMPWKGNVMFLPLARLSQSSMIDMLCDSTKKHHLLHSGGGFTRIYGPDGAPLATPLPEIEEGILYADIDLDFIGAAKAAYDLVGHYSRPDVVRLLFNNKKPTCACFQPGIHRRIRRRVEFFKNLKFVYHT